MLFHQEPVYKNISISILGRISPLLLKPSRERAIATRQVEQLQIRPPTVDTLLGMLSGGNQQKVALAKWLTLSAEAAGAVRADARHGCRRQERRRQHRPRTCATKGMAIIVLSTEPETVLSLADRIVVLKKGRGGARIRRRDRQQGPAAGSGVRRPNGDR